MSSPYKPLGHRKNCKCAQCKLRREWKTKLLLEKLSLLEHNQWAEWIEYMDKRAIHGETTVEFANGTWNEWLRKASFHYCDLTEEEKESDRKFAREVLALIRKEAEP